MIKETVFDTLKEGQAIIKNNPDRIELCDHLDVSGTTPALWFYKDIRKEFKKDIFVMIRNNSCLNFLFDEDEVKGMIQEIEMYAKEGANGFVLGALTKDKKVNKDIVSRLVKSAKNIPCTFSMAFDLIEDKSQAIKDLASVGIKRILTKGGEGYARNNVDSLKKIISEAKEVGIIIVVGGNITKENLPALHEQINAAEYHGKLII